MLMFDLYSDNRVIYREYIQNASDSIHKAIEQGIISAEEGHISIKIDPYCSKITIEDNGIGISVNDSERVLKDIANSEKGSQNGQAGYFGIGRLSGGGYCKKLTFKTSAKGENVASMVVFDVEAIRQILNDKDDHTSADVIIDNCTIFNCNFPEDEDAHYFNVIMEDILPQYSVVLDENAITDYLKEIAPLAFTSSFKKNILDADIDKEENASVKNYYEKLSTIKISINNTNDIRKLYKSKIIGTDEEIEQIRYFLLSDEVFGDLAWGWYAITLFDRAIPDEIDNKLNPTVGIRLRLHNILIGKRDFFDGTSYFKESRGNKYFNGELHVIHRNIKPTPQRDDLAPSPETKKLAEKIQDLFRKELEPVYKSANNLKSALNNYLTKKTISIKDLWDELKKKTNNIYYKSDNRLGYRYMVDLYSPKYESIFQENNYPPQIAEPQTEFTGSSNESVTSDVNSVSQTGNTGQQTIEFGGAPNSEGVSSQSNAGGTTSSNVGNMGSVGNGVSSTDCGGNNQPPMEPPSVPNNNTDVDWAEYYSLMGVEKTDMLRDIFSIIDTGFSKDNKKATISKTSKLIKHTILKSINKKIKKKK